MTDNNRLYILLSNMHRNFLCDYVNQTAKILAKTNVAVIVYYESPHTLFHLFKQRYLWHQVIREWKDFIRSNYKGMLSLDFISLIPFQRFGVIYRLNKKITKYQLKLLLFLRSLYHRKVFQNIYWVFHPSAEFLIEGLSLYDCVDYIEIKKSDDENLWKVEKRLISKVKNIFANSQLLAELKKEEKCYSYVVPCGCAVELFPVNYKPKHKPSELTGTKNPIIGFIGHLDYRIDFPLLQKIISGNQKMSFVFIGKVLKKEPVEKFQPDGSVSDNLKNLKRLPNFFLIHSKKKERLKDYMYYFSAGIIPYDNKYNFVYYSNPMKFYEYLAMGIPVVSSPIPALKKYQSETVRLTDDPNKFSDFLKMCTQKKLTKYQKTYMRKIAEENNWQAKIKAILSKIRIV